MFSAIKKIFSVQIKYRKIIIYILGIKITLNNFFVFSEEFFEIISKMQQDIEETKKIAKGFWNIEYFKKYGMRVPIENAWCSNDFEIIEIALKDIKFGDEDRTPLTDMPAYKALQKGDMNIYRDWISKYAQNKIDEDLAVKKFAKTFENIKQNGYKLEDGTILLTADDAVVDGHHRCCCLLHLFGGEHKIICLREK